MRIASWIILYAGTRIPFRSLLRRVAHLTNLSSPVKGHKPRFMADFRKIGIHSIAKARQRRMFGCRGPEGVTFGARTSIIDKPRLGHLGPRPEKKSVVFWQ